MPPPDAAATVQDAPAASEIGLVVIQQPNGDICLGEDPLAPKPAKTQQTQSASNEIVSHYLQQARDETTVAALAEQREQAQLYGKTTLRRRKILFISLVVCDLLFFAGALLYKAQQQRQAQHLSASAQQPAQSGPTSSQQTVFNATALDSNSSSMANTSLITDTTDSGGTSSRRWRHPLPVAWWLDPQTLRVEDAVFSMATDLLGITGALQNRTIILALYCVVQILSTAALTTMVNLSFSLFTMYRLLLLLLAFYLRSAICVYKALLDAAELAAARPTASHRLRQLLQRYPTVSAFIGGLSGHHSHPQQPHAGTGGTSGSSRPGSPLPTTQDPVLVGATDSTRSDSRLQATGSSSPRSAATSSTPSSPTVELAAEAARLEVAEAASAVAGVAGPSRLSYAAYNLETREQRPNEQQYSAVG